jgi:3-oxoacyl-[acyl-carrier-protein] synthase-3
VILKFKKKAISGILTVLPRNESLFDDEMLNFNFSKSQSLKLKLVMGYNKHRIITEDQSSSDLCIFGLSYLFDNKLLDKNEIDALVVVTQSPDYIMPPTSYIIHGHFGLKQDMLCLDINQGCAGFIIGLYQAFLLLEQESINKVVLCNVDILSRKVSKQDRNSYPLIGDGASITIVEKSEMPYEIVGVIKVDGSRANALMIPAGGFKYPSSAETAVLHEDDKGNLRAQDHLVMKGDAVFNFVQMEVPTLIRETLSLAGLHKDEVDYYMFHQPNRFMLQKLTDNLEIPYAKMPSNIVENFGNASGVTIPTAITYNLSSHLCKETYKMCLAGFGVGLTWGSLVMDIGNLYFCKIIEI